MLPKDLLAAPIITRSGTAGAGHHTFVNILKRRILPWRLVEFHDLWNEAKYLQSPRSSRMPDKECQDAYNRRRTITLSREGAYSKATQAVCSTGLLPPSEALIAALTEKHPQTTPKNEGEYQAPSVLPIARKVSEDDVLKAVEKFAPGSSGGGSGLRPNHLQELCTVHDSGNGTTFTAALTRFVNLVLSGRGPTEISPWLRGAPLTALKKRSGGVRPIAVGETLCRLISSCAMAHASKSAAEWLRPIQMGIAAPNGCESVVHGVRRFIEKHSDCSKFGLL